MKRRSWLVGRIVVIVSMVALMVGAFGSAGATGVPETAIPWLDTGYRYSIVNDISFTGADFAAPSYDDSAWATGDAGFGTDDYAGCTLTSPSFVKTSWPLNTEMLLRKHFSLPAGANNMKVSVAIDNDVQVYVNGVDVSNGIQTHDGCAARDSFIFTVPDSALNTGDNVIAVRGVDRGTADYLDIQVTYDAPTYHICPLYDVTKAHQAGSTVPLKLQLCDENGNNLSSPDIVVHATGIQMVSGNSTGVLDDSGSSNSPDMDFRYDPTLDGYIFNLSTKGLASGTWKVTFDVNGEVQTTYYAQFVVR